jgi:hypothetical protein
MSALKRYPRGVLDPTSYRLTTPAVRRSSPITVADLFIAAYPDPIQYDSAESHARYHHHDIPALDDDALADELLLARIRRAAEYMTRQHPSPWLYERIRRMVGEAARRRQAARR